MQAHHLSLSLLIAAALWLTGCGYTDPGEGTETLQVVAEGRFYANSANMLIEVTVRDQQGNDVRDATVELRTPQQEVPVTVPVVPFTNQGVYRTLVESYLRRVELSVVSGSDNLTAKLEGPGPHTIGAPRNAASKKVDDNLKVRWLTEDGLQADHVVISLDHAGFSSTENDDKGRHKIPSESLDVGNEVVRVERENRVELDGGTGTSYFVISYRSGNDLTLLAE